MKRRNAFMLGGAVTVAATVGTAAWAAADPATDSGDPTDAAAIAKKVRRIYEKHSAVAGTWESFITVIDADGSHVTAVEHDADTICDAASINKVAIAMAVCDKIDRGELAMDDKVELTADIIAAGSGFYFLQTAFGDQLTVANVITAMLLVSDNTAVRLCGLVCDGNEVNAALEAKGFTHTRVIPVEDNPKRMWLGETTPRESHELLTRLLAGELISPEMTRFLFGILRAGNGYHDGFRRTMSSEERSRIAIKYGADDADRHEIGIVFNSAGAPVLVFSVFGQHLDHQNNYGATHPLVQAHARMGREMLDAAQSLESSVATAVDLPVIRHDPSDKG